MFIENVLKVKNDWWRYFIGCLVIFIGTQIGIIPFFSFEILDLSTSKQVILCPEEAKQADVTKPT